MYSMSKDTYTCDECGFEDKWDAHDAHADYHGGIWECEYCGEHFCATCFIKAAGREAFDRMLQETDTVLCAKHYEEGVFEK